MQVLPTLILGVAAAIIALIAQKELAKETLPLAILLVVLGVYGAIASEKLYERHQFHSERAWAWRDKINEMHPNIHLLILKSEAVKKHNRKFPRMS